MLGRSTPKKTMDVKRDAVTDATPVEGNLVRVKQPKFLSVVGHPANETGFKVVRSDATTAPAKAPANNQAVLRRTKRSAATSPVLRLTFPDGTDEAFVQTALTEYGLEGYTVTQENGVYTASRSDSLHSNANTMDIRLSEDGLVATVIRSSTPVVEAKSSLTLARLEFDSSKFTLEDVQRWASEKCVDGEVQDTQNASACYVVRRSDVPDNEETRLMEIEDGVQAVIVRSDATDVPAGFVAVINEAAYGSWGWGQLDFAASMADEAFSEQMRQGIRTLEDVLRNIVIYSPLPLDVRKELANRALAQYGEFIGTVMDSLPRQLLVAVVRSAHHSQPEKEMTTQTSAATTQTTPAAQTTPEVALTRADVAAMIADAVKAASTPVVTETTPAVTTPAATEEKALTRSDVADLVKDALTPLVDSIKSLQGETVVRSAQEHTPTTPEKKSTDVFRGAFPGLRIKQ